MNSKNNPVTWYVTNKMLKTKKKGRGDEKRNEDAEGKRETNEGWIRRTIQQLDTWQNEMLRHYKKKQRWQKQKEIKTQKEKERDGSGTSPSTSGLTGVARESRGWRKGGGGAGGGGRRGRGFRRKKNNNKRTAAIRTDCDDRSVNLSEPNRSFSDRFFFQLLVTFPRRRLDLLVPSRSGRDQRHYLVLPSFASLSGFCVSLFGFPQKISRILSRIIGSVDLSLMVPITKWLDQLLFF